jgi:hypothetical protein
MGVIYYSTERDFEMLGHVQLPHKLTVALFLFCITQKYELHFQCISGNTKFGKNL